MADFEYDAFISHAFEDKADFVTPLANTLRKYGLKTWYDDFELKVGDSLRASVESGLSRSRYGIVVFSPRFLSKKKQWPKAELNALFQREMDGHKVILPIWHEVSSKRMKSILPIQADKKALRSSDGVEAVARSLVEVIRPELLRLEVMQKSAFEAIDSFVAEAGRHFPGYGFEMRPADADPPPSGMAFMKGDSNHRVDIRIVDASLIPGPPGGKVRFFGEGASKAIEFQRTGKAQTWLPGEFDLKLRNAPFMPDNTDGSILSVGNRKAPEAATRHMRVEIVSNSQVVFPIMEMRAIRLGTHESEALISDKESPLSISVLSPIGSEARLDLSQEVEISLSWEPSGKRANECKRMIEAIDALRSGGALRIIDIRLDRPIFEAAAKTFPDDDPFAEPYRRLVLLASQLEQTFGVPLRIPEVLSKEDQESLFHLDCLLNNRDYGTAGNTELRLKKADGDLGEAQAAFLRGTGKYSHFAAPTDYPGYFPLFGQQVATGPWVRAIEFAPVDPEAASKAFSDSPLGTEIEVEVAPKGPAHLQWQEPSQSTQESSNG